MENDDIGKTVKRTNIWFGIRLNLLLNVAVKTAGFNHLFFCWTASHQLPVIMETMAQAVVVPRIDNEGLLRSVTLLNCSISEQPETQLRLRGCDTEKKQKFVWKRAGQPDITLRPQYDGTDVIIRIPTLEGWNVGWLAIR